MTTTINADNGVVSGSAGLKSSADSSGVLALQTNGTTAISIDTSQAVTVNGNTTLGDASTDTILMTGAPSIGGAGYGMGMGFRNRIINGAMVIDQRNAGASVTPAQGVIYTLDRWALQSSVTSKFSIQQNAGSVTPPVGFSKYLGATSLSAYSIGAGDYFTVQQAIEGFNTSDLGFGTANAKTVTLSFQVYSSLTGTFGGSLQNSAGNRSYPFSYSIPVANTWTTISVTIAGDTTGTWVGATNGVGLFIYFGLGNGSTFSGTAGAWAGANYVSATGATSVVGTNGATFYITGVQLEKGSTATAFDYRPYGTELALCQRYFWKLVGTGTSNQYAALGAGVCTSTTNGRAVFQYPVQMRTAPTFSYGGNIYFEDGSGGHAISAIATSFANVQSAFVDLTTTGLTLGRGVCTFTGNQTTDYFQASSEL